MFRAIVFSVGGAVLYRLASSRFERHVAAVNRDLPTRDGPWANWSPRS